MTVLDILPNVFVSSFTAKVAAVLVIPFLFLTITYIIVVPNILKVNTPPSSQHHQLTILPRTHAAATFPRDLLASRSSVPS